ncbi:MAG TPA: HAMP domain-containing sensor histidine kinase [Gemmatimonadaceae bacterium]|nr:HAMP domain-containing sensor histidine kinase [Gemmatimonadaceae bacterium]
MIHTRLETPVAAGTPTLRELVALREIVHAFLTADRAEEVFQFALERVRPLVGASFASIYVIDGNSDVMRLAAACNWPERYRPFLGEMRVRLGRGPSGAAASERRTILVPDVRTDLSSSDWRDVAGELGFRAIVALPLETRGKVLGAVAFYFAEAGGPGTEELGLLQIVADQLAATAEKSAMIDELRRTNAALVESNAELETQYLAALEARRLKDEFLANMSHELRTPLTSVLGYAYLLQEGLSGPLTGEQTHTLAQMTSASERLLEMIDDLLELTTLKRGETRVTVDAFDPREVLRDAVRAVKGPPEGVALHVEAPADQTMCMRSDRKKVVKILANLLSNAYKFTARGEVRASVEVRNEVVRFNVRDSGIGIAPEAQGIVFDEFRQVDGSPTRVRGGPGLGLALSRQFARLLGGEIELESKVDAGSSFTVELPLEYIPDTPPPILADSPPHLGLR